jgi:GDP-4-dehydro-6-deoxy-D-mannose reductase
MELFQLGEGDIAADSTDNFTAPEGVRKIAWKLPGPPPSSLGRVKYVIHLAGISSVAHSLAGEETVMNVNTEGTGSVVRWVKQRSPEAVFLFASSAEVYKPSLSCLSEDSPPGPVSPYGESKLKAEKLLAASGIRYVVSRSFPHFGPGQAGHFVLPSFCRRVIRSIKSGQRVISTGNLCAVRDYLYIDDVVRAYACLLSRGEIGEAYNVCSGTGKSIGDLLSIITGISGEEFVTKADPGLVRSNDQFSQVGDPGKLKVIGWTAGVSLEEGLTILYRWWKERL